MVVKSSSHGLALLRSKPGFAANEEQWVGQKQLGTGGQGCAGLFVRRDPTTQRIIERMVVKEELNVSAKAWKDEFEFYGPKKDIPKEQYMSMIMPQDSKNTIRIWGSRLCREQNSFRVYMDYCPGGDLRDLFDAYFDRTPPRLEFPEPYLWKLFQDLARAVHAMESLSGHGVEGDEAIAHIDFKPSNIFLCLPDENDFPRYPYAKLGDFGGAMICSPRDTAEEHNKKVDSISTTIGYIAPDVERFFKNASANIIPVRDRRPGITLADIPKRVTSATNVWNAALIIADLMAPQRFDPPAFDSQVYAARDTWIDNFVNQKDTHLILRRYSSLLKDTVIECLNYNPNQRPTPVDLLAKLDHGVSLHASVMQTKDCLDATKYHGEHDLDPSIPFVDDYPVTQPEDWDMDFTEAKSMSREKPMPFTPQKKPQNHPQSITTAAGAPQDTPAQGFLVGPNAGQFTQKFYDPAAEYEQVEHSVRQSNFVDQEGLLQALDNEMG